MKDSKSPSFSIFFSILVIIKQSLLILAIAGGFVALAQVLATVWFKNAKCLFFPVNLPCLSFELRNNNNLREINFETSNSSSETDSSTDSSTDPSIDWKNVRKLAVTSNNQLSKINLSGLSNLEELLIRDNENLETITLKNLEQLTRLTIINNDKLCEVNLPELIRLQLTISDNDTFAEFDKGETCPAQVRSSTDL